MPLQEKTAKSDSVYTVEKKMLAGLKAKARTAICETLFENPIRRSMSPNNVADTRKAIRLTSTAIHTSTSRSVTALDSAPSQLHTSTNEVAMNLSNNGKSGKKANWCSA